MADLHSNSNHYSNNTNDHPRLLDCVQSNGEGGVIHFDKNEGEKWDSCVSGQFMCGQFVSG
jgi:hypothetical protein